MVSEAVEKKNFYFVNVSTLVHSFVQFCFHYVRVQKFVFFILFN